MSEINWEGTKVGAWIYTDFHMKCPGCNNIIMFKRGGIEVNCETKNIMPVPGLLTLWYGCDNPLCKWSKVK